MKVIIALSMIFVLLLSAGASSGRDFDRKLDQAVKPHRFNLTGWEIKTLFGRIGQNIWSRAGKGEDGAGAVSEYVTLGNRIQALESQIDSTNCGTLQPELAGLQKQREALAETVETTIKRQLVATLREHGIYQPWYKNIRLKLGFPPLDFKLESLPHLLVISPRDRIETLKTVLLVKDLNSPTMENIETAVDKLDVSSLVADVGGLGTYPNLVGTDFGLQFILDTAAHEWTHEYLSFTPLGFRYVLGLSGLRQNPDIVTLNETVADIVGKEIGAAVREKYYARPETKTLPNQPAFDFDREMRDIRKTLDGYLAKGEVEAAEKFMNEKRDYLATKGYHIRKLNQAYFAFNGQYADTPAFASPVGAELKQLRARSASLGEFLSAAASLTGRHDLRLALGQD